MRRLLAATALGACLCAPAAAPAATSWTIKGAGWGHGIGMSQYGAYGQAQQGRNYQQILGHYYSGTVVSRASTRTIRVLLHASRSSVSFSGATRAGNKTLSASKTYVARPSGAGVVIRASGGKRVATFTTIPVRITSSRGYVRLGGTAMNGVTSGNYRGALELRPGMGGGVTAVNALSLDQYVMGVVPGEMPSSWHSEALKAQAVAARSYALATDRGGSVFDQYPDTRSQVYRGMTGEVSSTNDAVRATSSEVVTHNGQIVVTYFFSTSGGHTENIENVWGGEPVPYLKGVEDPYDKLSPRHRWRIGPLSRRGITARFGSLCRGSFRALKVRKRGVSPRIVSADVVCSRGTVRATGAQLRTTLGLYDSWFRVVRTDSRAKRAGTAVSRALARQS
jgi:stage II sporulation protein D